MASAYSSVASHAEICRAWDVLVHMCSAIGLTTELVGWSREPKVTPTNSIYS